MGESNPARGIVRRLDPPRVKVRLGEAEIEIAPTGAADGEGHVAVRPEAITVEPSPGRKARSPEDRQSELSRHAHGIFHRHGGRHAVRTCPGRASPGGGNRRASGWPPEGVIIVGQ